MLRLDPLTEPTWLDLGDGIRVRVLPLSSVIMARAAEMVSTREDLPPVDPESGERPASQAAVAALTEAVAQVAILDWDGPGDTDGNPAPVTPAYIAALMAIRRYEAVFFGRYVARAFAMASEKNVSAPLQTGTSAGAETIAAPVTASALTALAD